MAVSRLSLVFGAALLGFASNAFAFEKCDAETDAKKKEKCEATEAKQVAKLRKSTTPFKPSALDAKFAALDGDDKNPFNQDDYYVGNIETGSKSFDELAGSVARINAALTMARYADSLAKAGKNDEAKAIAADLIPVLAKLKDDVKAIKESIDKVKADPAAIVKDNPMALPKVAKALPGLLTTVVDAATGIPAAIKSVDTLAKGAGAAAVEMATDKAKDAASN
jgi:hypothetical protein